MIKITSLHLKTALLYYYRFKRGYLVCDEVYTANREKADILVDAKKEFYEIEIKTSKSDLRAEKKKKKHKESAKPGANKFYICVPTSLVPYAEKWIEEINPRYGLIEFDEERYEKQKKFLRTKWDLFLHFRKHASALHGDYNKRLKQKIIKRLPSALYNAYINLIELIEKKPC